MITSLANKVVGPPDNTFTWMLHTSGENPQLFTTGVHIGTGNAQATGLVLWDESLGIHNGNFTTKFLCLATADREIELPDAAGRVVLGDGAGITDVTAFRGVLGSASTVLAVTETNSTLVPANVAGLSFAVAGAGVYRFKYFLRMQTSNASTGARVELDGPAVDHVHYIIERDGQKEWADAWGGQMEWGGFPAQDQDILVIIEGVAKITAAGTVNVRFWSEDDAIPVRVMSGSVVEVQTLG